MYGYVESVPLLARSEPVEELVQQCEGIATSAPSVNVREKSKSRTSSQNASALPLRRRKTSVSLRKKSNGETWELVHPPCALERVEDLAEAEGMVSAGETEIAREELLWLLTECRDLIAAHRLLGEIALTDADLKLARAHFGHAFEIGWSALPPSGLKGILPYSLEPNRAFLESGKGLIHTLQELGNADSAQSVARILLDLDPSDPLGVREWVTR